MQAVNSQSSPVGSMSAMKKAIDTQGQNVLKLLDSAQVSSSLQKPQDTSAITGLGKNLDIKV
jgi:hypothetical protein